MAANTQVQLLNAVCKNQEAFAILGEDPVIFGSYQAEFEWVRDYFNQYRQAPSTDLLRDRFPDVDIVDVNAPSHYYVQQLRHGHLEAEMRALVKKVASAIDNEEPVDGILEKLQTKTAKLGRFVNAPQDVNLKDVEHMKEHLANVRKTVEENDGVAGIPTRFASINSAYTTGFAPGNLITIFGYSGKMKSMFAMDSAVYAHDLGNKVMYVNLEMNAEEQTERLVALKARGIFSMTDWSRGDINEDDLDEWARKNLADSPNFIMINTEGIPDVTPNFVQSKIEKYKPDIVFLDYLQLMSDNAKSTQQVQRMMHLSGEIKRLATSNNIPIVAIAAVSDDEKDKRDAPPQIKQISWSKGIEYNSNLAIAVHLHNESGRIEVVCRKNRRGPLFNFELDANKVDRGIIEEVFDYV